ncbi:MAG: S24/S26 family peptidase [Tannerella sp.]|jgi:hypothetical protein|nr:S24/S26 family peptidase [Tannerella sp.]
MICLDETITLPNESFFTTVKVLLDEGKQVRIPVKGSSMRPFLSDGDAVELIAVNGKSIHWGAIVLAYFEGRMVLHRVVRKKKDNVWLMGDAHSRYREKITVGDVWAITGTAYRSGKVLKLDSFAQRCASVCWFGLMPFRGILLKSMEILNKSLR